MSCRWRIVVAAVVLIALLSTPGAVEALGRGQASGQSTSFAGPVLLTMSSPHGTPPALPGSVHPLIAGPTTVIWPNGTVSNSTAPLTISGSTYTITAGFIGGLLVERNGSVLNGNGHLLQMATGLASAIEVFQAIGVVVENFTILNASEGVHLEGVQGGQVIHNMISGSSWAVSALHSSNITISANTAVRTAGVFAGFDSVVNVSANSLWASSSSAVSVQESSNVRVLNNQENGSTNGTWVRFSSNVTVEGNNLSSTACGLGEYQVTSSMVRGNLFAFSRAAINASYSTDLNISDDVGRNGTFGVETYSVANLVVAHENFTGFTFGLSLNATTNASVTRSSFLHSTHGAAVEYSTGVFLTGNNVSYFAQDGFLVAYSSGIHLSANTAEFGTQSTSRGFFTEFDSGVSLIRNFGSYNPIGEFDQGSGNLTLVGNSFAHTSGANAAIDLSTDRGVQLLSNFVFNASAYGIRADRAQGLVASENNVSFAGLTAVLVSNTSSGTITSNRVDHARLFGLDLRSSNLLTVSQNLGGFTTASSGIGIRAVSVTGSALTSNNVTNTNVSLYLSSCSSVWVGANNASESAYGIWLDGNVNTTVSGNQFGSDRFAFWVRGNTGSGIYHNNFVNNTGWEILPSVQSISWDAGFPEGGNYWSNHSSPDVKAGPNQTWAGTDGLVDIPLVLNSSNVDRFPLTTPWPGFTITFTASGLTSGSVWSVVVNGVTYFSQTNSIVVPQTNGPGATYRFTVPPVPGLYPATPPSGGPWPESRSNLQVSIVFVPFLYPVTFHVYGVAPGVQWGITVGTITILSTAATATAELRNGTYFYIAGKVDGYTVAVGSGGFAVIGAVVQLTIVYTTVATGATTYGAGFVYFLSGVLLLAVLAAIAAFALWVRERRGKRPTAATPWSPPLWSLGARNDGASNTEEESGPGRPPADVSQPNAPPSKTGE